MLKFQDLFETYAPDLYRFALWMAGDPSDAEDITSETIVRAWARRGKLHTETLKAYLFAIARNIYLEKLRKRKRQVDLGEDHPDPFPGPEKIVESRLDIQRIQSVLQGVPEIDRAAFLMRIQYELPYAEIARVLELNLTTVKVKVHRVRKKLLVSFLEKEVTK